MALTLHEIHRDDDVLTIGLRGSLDGHSIAAFAERLDEIVDAAVRTVVVDCAEVTMISSHGLGALLTLHKKLELRGGEVCLARTTGVPALIIYMTRLDKIFRRFDDVHDAVAATRRNER